MKKYPALKKLLRKKNRPYYWVLGIAFVITMTCIAISFVLFVKDEPEAVHFDEAIIENKEGQWSYLNVEYVSDYFATYELDNTIQDYYYFVWEGDYIYIANLDADTLNHELGDIYFNNDDNQEVTPATIYGISTKINPELKKIAMETLNEWYGEGTVTNENFNDIVGSVLINVKETPNTISEVPLVIGLIAFIIFIIFVNVVTIFEIMTKRTIKHTSTEDLEAIEDYIANDRGLHIEGTGIYLTDKYVVSVANSLQLYQYPDIYWVYLYRVRYYGATTSISIKLGDQRRKIHTIGESSRKYEDAMVELLNEIARRSPNALVGYTKENKKAFKQKN